MFGSRYLSFIMIVLIALKLTYNSSNLSFFLIKRIGNPARDLDFYISSFIRFMLMYV
jgi:hypothetical protein